MRCIFPNLFMGCSHFKIGLMDSSPVNIKLEVKKYSANSLTIFSLKSYPFHIFEVCNQCNRYIYNDAVFFHTNQHSLEAVTRRTNDGLVTLNRLV